MPRNEPTGTRFSDKQVAAILRRAAEIQQAGRVATPEEGIAPEELVQIGGEIGLDPESVKTAIKELRLGGRLVEHKELFGGPTRVEVEREVEGALTDDAWEAIVADARRSFGKLGTIHSAGGMQEWTGGDRELDPTSLSLRASSGKVRIRMTSDLSPALFLIGMISSLITLVTCLGIGQTVEFELWIKLVSIPAVCAFAFFLLRSVHTGMCRRRAEAVESIVDRTEDLLSKQTQPQSATIAGEQEAQEEPLKSRIEGA